MPAPPLPRTSVGGSYEQWLAYAVGSCFGSGFPSLRLLLISYLAMTGAAMVFELLQNFIPGRTTDIYAFVASALGAWSGLVMAILSHAVFKAIRISPR